MIPVYFQQVCVWQSLHEFLPACFGKQFVYRLTLFEFIVLLLLSMQRDPIALKTNI